MLIVIPFSEQPQRSETKLDGIKQIARNGVEPGGNEGVIVWILISWEAGWPDVSFEVLVFIFGQFLVCGVTDVVAQVGGRCPQDVSGVHFVDGDVTALYRTTAKVWIFCYLIF